VVCPSCPSIADIPEGGSAYVIDFMGADGVLGGEVPISFSAVTTNVYVVPITIPSRASLNSMDVSGIVPGMSVFVISPGVDTIVYVGVTYEEDAVHETRIPPGDGGLIATVTSVGAVGAVGAGGGAGGVGGTAEFACKTAANSSPDPLVVPTAYRTVDVPALAPLEFIRFAVP
jgi:hypothetical protein